MDCSASGAALDASSAALPGLSNTQFSSLLAQQPNLRPSGATNTLRNPQLMPPSAMLIKPSSAQSSQMAAAFNSGSDQANQAITSHVSTAAQQQFAPPPPQLSHQQVLQQRAHQQQQMHQQMSMMSTMHSANASRFAQHKQEQAVWEQQQKELQQQQLLQREAERVRDDVTQQPASMAEMAAAWKAAESEHNAEISTFGIEGPRSEYQFTTTEFMRTPDMDVFAVGVDAFTAGDLKRAVSCFEEVLRNEPSRTDAWRFLGKCHCELDADDQAIICLETAVQHDPYCLESLLQLGVSYVNEMDTVRAGRSLKAWIKHNPKYARMAAQMPEISGSDEQSIHSVIALMKSAAAISPDDADVLEALGVCYNVSKQFELAVDCLRAATSIQPENYATWNKLGATLANGKRPDEALQCYEKALAIKPRYARCWLNLAISHSNLKDYSSAARAYLQTLALAPSAVQCWSYLRLSLTCLERWDLLPFATSMEIDKFADEFDFVVPS